jgi:hypothetical protein
MNQGRLAAVRLFRAGGADAALVTQAIGASGAARGHHVRARVMAVGADAPRGELVRGLASAGLTVAAPPAEWTARAAEPDLLAASFAGAGAAPLFRTEARSSRASPPRRSCSSPARR